MLHTIVEEVNPAFSVHGTKRITYPKSPRVYGAAVWYTSDMARALIFDLSRVLLFPRDKNYAGGLNNLYKQISTNPGYKFFDHFRVNDKLLSYLKDIRSRVSLYLFTSEIIQDAPELRPSLESIFKGIYSASKMGLHKDQPDAYLRVAKELGVEPEEAVFIDDAPKNIQAAESAGLKTITYCSNNQLFKEMVALGL